MKKNSGFTAFEGLVILAVFSIVGFGAWYVWSTRFKDDSGTKKSQQYSITTFEECAAAGYPVMESYPEQCAIPGGESFVRILSENSASTEVPEVDLVEYNNADAHVKFSYPETWTHEIQSESYDKGKLEEVEGIIISPTGTRITWSYGIGGKGGGQVCYPEEDDVPFIDEVENCVPTQLSNIEVTQPASEKSTGLYIDHRRYSQKDSTSYNICLNSYNFKDGAPEESVFYREVLGLPCNATAPMAHILLTDSEATNPELVKTIEAIFKSFRITS